MKTYCQLLEDIELMSGIRRDTRGEMRSVHDQLSGRSKNLGKIHKDYSLHKSDGDFFIRHDESKKVVGHIVNQTHYKSRSLEVNMIAVHPDHTKKKIGHSLALAAYKHLHGKHGYTIKSGNEQSFGGASIWHGLMNDPKTKKHVHAVHHPYGGKKTDLGQASKLHPGDIWQSGSGEVRRKAASKGVRMHKYSSDATDRAMDTHLELRAKKK